MPKPTARLDRLSQTNRRSARGLSSLRGTGEAWMYLDLDSAWNAISQNTDDYWNDADSLNSEVAQWVADTLNNSGFNASVEERNASNQFNSTYDIAVVDGEIARSTVEALLSDVKSFMKENASSLVFAPVSSDDSSVQGVKKLIDNIKLKNTFPDTTGIRLGFVSSRMKEHPCVHFKNVDDSGDGGGGDNGGSGGGSDGGSDGGGDGGGSGTRGVFSAAQVQSGEIISGPDPRLSSEFRRKGGTVRVTIIPRNFDPIDDPVDPVDPPPGDDPVRDPVDPVRDPVRTLRGMRGPSQKPTMRLPSRRTRRSAGLGQTGVQSFTLTVPPGGVTTRADGTVRVSINERIPSEISDALRSGSTVSVVVQSVGTGGGGNGDGSNGGNGNGGNGNGGGSNGGNGGGRNGGGGGDGGDGNGGRNGGGTGPDGQQAGLVPGVSNTTLFLGATGIVSLALIASAN